MQLTQTFDALLSSLLYEPHGDVESLLNGMKEGQNGDKLKEFMGTLQNLPKERALYLKGIISLKAGDIGAAFNNISAYCKGNYADIYAFYNLGRIAEASYDLSKSGPLLDVAIEFYQLAWRKDNSFTPASEALRVIIRDRLDMANQLLNKLGKNTRAVIEPTTYCHLKCCGCTRTIEDTPSIHMPLPVFKKVIDHLPRVADIVLHGLGEPSLNKNLPEMIAYAIQSKKTEVISFSTTGLTKDFSVYERCFASGLSYLRVSVDSLTPDIAEICRKGTNIQLLEETILKLVAGGYPIEIVMVVSRMNLDDIEKTLWRLDSLGSFKVRGLMYADKGESAGTLDSQGITRANAIFDDMHSKVRNLDISYVNNFAAGFYDICGSVTDITVDVGGFLTPCCHVLDRSIYKHLSLAEHSYEEIRLSQFMKDFMTDFVDQSPDFCGGCPMSCRPAKKNAYPSIRDFADRPNLASAC